MKKIIFPVAVIFVVLNFNTSYSQDVSISKNLDNSSQILSNNTKELLNIVSDLVHMVRGPNYLNKVIMVENLKKTLMIYDHQSDLIFMNTYVSGDYLKEYYIYLKASLASSKDRIMGYYRTIQDRYGSLENKAVMHTFDKAKENIRNSLGEIESTIMLLDNEIRSMQ